MTAPLEIPRAALAANAAPHAVLLTDEDVADRIREIARPVVAADIRRFAFELIKPYDPTGADFRLVDAIATRLLDRATELDGQVVCPNCTNLMSKWLQGRECPACTRGYSDGGVR